MNDSKEIKNLYFVRLSDYIMLQNCIMKNVNLKTKQFWNSVERYSYFDIWKIILKQCQKNSIVWF